MEYQKAKSTPKIIKTRGADLTRTILDTVGIISKAVGDTLGPGGRPVILERYEHDLLPAITKDGVTVFKSLGFEDPVRQVILESFRDASQRTASEAGDATTTATVLGASLIQLINQYCENNPKVSPQKVVRHLQSVYETHVEPSLRKWAIKADSTTEAGRKVLESVATISANSDKELAKAVMECFNLVGDAGNITITERNGNSRYEVEPVKGYTVGVGYDESCGKFSPAFINDSATQQCRLDNPVFVVYNGTISEPRAIMEMLSALVDMQNNNIVLVAAGFSETVIGYLATMFSSAQAFNIFPLSIARPMNAIFNSQLHLFEDICAMTGASLMNPLNRQLYTITPADVGPGIERFEASRSRSNIVGTASKEPDDQYAEALLAHITDVTIMLENAEGEYEKGILQERIGKLSGGIARLIVYGSSSGDQRERKDRADDAICSVRSAISDGILPGGGWALLKLAHRVLPHDDITHSILFQAFKVPLNRLLDNCGFNEEEVHEITNKIVMGFSDENSNQVYDAYNQTFCDALKGGVVDSLLAVLCAIKNSLSIASILGVSGGIVCFGRDLAFEAQEAHSTAEFLRNSNVNEANNRP